MFPASAGMNRVIRRHGTLKTYVPRERGDEPNVEQTRNHDSAHVPRERGDEPDGCMSPVDQRECSPRARG